VWQWRGAGDASKNWGDKKILDGTSGETCFFLNKFFTILGYFSNM
jgi:hypothetical protein